MSPEATQSVHDRTARFLDPLARRRHEIVTPEGVLLRVERAEYGERASAFLLDVLFLVGLDAGLFMLCVLLAFLAHRAIDPRIIWQVVLFLAFLVRNFYFIHFELSWQGVTPGKRIAGLRVIDRHGGPLQPSAVVARNLMRELEIFTPLQAVLSAAAIGPALWSRLALLAWLVLVALLPFFNRDRLRIGDLLAGTMVIAMPKRRLLDDLAQSEAGQGFTPQELGTYGAFELQVLEELLRRPDSAETEELQRDVCERICRRISRTPPATAVDVAAFLRRFYTAQRAFLEREQLYGRMRAEKAQADPLAEPTGAGAASVEHRGDATGVDAFLGDAQVVVHHHAGDREIGVHHGVDSKTDQSPDHQAQGQPDDGGRGSPRRAGDDQ